MFDALDCSAWGVLCGTAWVSRHILSVQQPAVMQAGHSLTVIINWRNLYEGKTNFSSFSTLACVSHFSLAASQDGSTRTAVLLLWTTNCKRLSFLAHVSIATNWPPNRSSFLSSFLSFQNQETADQKHPTSPAVGGQFLYFFFCVNLASFTQSVFPFLLCVCERLHQKFLISPCPLNVFFNHLLCWKKIL